MKPNELLEVIGEAQDDYILDAKTPIKKQPAVWIKWVAVAACFCLILTGTLALFDHSNPSQPDTSPFVLTAYALGADNKLSATPMTEGENVPISTFEAGNGMTGFVFSNKSNDSGQSVSVSITGTDFSSYVMSDTWKSSTSETVGSISSIDLQKTLNYIFVVPSEGEEPPYRLTINVYDEASGTLVLLTLVIDENNGNYTAKIETIHDYKLVADIDELLKPYQEVIDRLNEKYNCGLLIPEDRKISVYMAYKDMTPEEFEKQITIELEASISGERSEYDDSGTSFGVINIPKEDAFYKFNRTGITEITGTSQMSDPVKKVVLPSASVEKFVKQIEELCLQPTGTDDNAKGWEYFFAIKYDDGSTTSITLSEGKINIDGKVYKTTLYRSNDFSTYFD